jgi:hypothetical protein
MLAFRDLAAGEAVGRAAIGRELRPSDTRTGAHGRSRQTTRRCGAGSRVSARIQESQEHEDAQGADQLGKELLCGREPHGEKEDRVQLERKLHRSGELFPVVS